MSQQQQIVPWSYSAISAFETCPRQYEAKWVTKEVPYQETPETRWGNDVHNALERYIRDGEPMPSNMTQYKKFADAVLARPGEVIAEEGVALTWDLKEVSWFTKKTAKNPVWFRTKIDVTILNGDTAEILDWKTGKRKDDLDQLKLYALVAFIRYPQVQTVKTGFVWLKEGKLSGPFRFSRKGFDALMEHWMEKYEALEEAHKTGNFPPQPSGLCHGWCPVTSCPHWRPKK